MKWSVIRLQDDSAVVTVTLTRTEANDVLKDMKTWDESPQASKDMFHAVMVAADDRGGNLYRMISNVYEERS